ncbi:MAG: dockerin type I repeat-containing protein, partial [Oscillospiraceae bacterium]|nr:dockerin type I repeat-containing protein [Oscillospiraceae bacterium]
MNAELLPTSLPVPNQTDNSEYRKLAVHLTNTKDTTISVACIPLKAGEAKPSWIPSVKAISEWTAQTIEGDVNADGQFNVADVVALQKWLLAIPDVMLADWKAADFCADNRLDALDLTLMKRSLLQDSITEPQVQVLS